VTVLGSEGTTITALESLKLGHKIALLPIAKGATAVKYGVSIGGATKDISPGQWVHLHNLGSSYDERSQTLDLHTGATTDTVYE